MANLVPLGLDVSNRAVRITDRTILNRWRIESRNMKPTLKVKTAIRSVFGLAIRIV